MTKSSGRLAGKVVLVTGSARGIGSVIARVFAEAGASVVLCDVRDEAGVATAKAINDAGYSALFTKADLRREDDIKRMIDFSVDNFHRLDILINNARPSMRNVSFIESLDEWDVAMDILVKAPALAIKYAVRYFLKTGGGAVINIASTNAFLVSHQPAAYHVAKAAILQLTRYAAYELGPKGIRVNAICPALVDLYDEDKPLTSNPTNKAITELIVPLRRAALAEEIADAAVFLSSESSSYITGETLTVDGGLTLGDQFHGARKAFDFHEQSTKDVIT